jgi:hypothetical protein
VLLLLFVDEDAMPNPQRGPEEAKVSPAPTGASAAPAPSADTEPTDPFRGFMVALATDPAKLGAFIKDPDATMTAAGIEDVDQVILKSGHAATIHARLSGQKFSLTPPAPTTPVTVLVVDMNRQPGAPASAASDQPTVRAAAGFAGPSGYGSSTMYPNTPVQIFPQVHPQVHPQLVIHPQIYPQVHPQVVVHPQIFPQVHPQIHPQIHPQLVLHPQIYPQIHPQLVYPQIHPQLVYPQFSYPGAGG